MKKIFMQIISCVLVIASLFSGSAVAYQAEDSQTEGRWEAHLDDSGKTYLVNTKTGERMVGAFRFDEQGNQVPVDLNEHAKILNEGTALREAERRIANHTTSDATVSSIPGTVYFYKESYTYKTTGAAVKVSPDVKGPASITSGLAATVSESMSGGINLTWDMKDRIRAGASFSWSTTASTSSTFSVTYVVRNGKTGYVRFTPKVNVTQGYLEYYTYQGELLVDSGQINNISGRSPIKLANGFADGTFELIEF